MCTAVLLALGSHSPGMVIIRLWDRLDVQNVPPRSLLVAVGKLSLCQGMARCGEKVSLGAPETNNNNKKKKSV